MSSRVTARARHRDAVSTGLPARSARLVALDERVSALMERREPGAGRAFIPLTIGAVERGWNERREGAAVPPRSITFDLFIGRVVEVPVPRARQVDPFVVGLLGRTELPALLPEFRAEPDLVREGVGGVYVGRLRSEE